MKVLLTQDVYNLGHAGEVKTVADGYGRNYLLPRGLAVLATQATLKSADAVRTAALKRRAQEQSDIDATSQVIGGTTIYFSVRTGEKGKLYGSITAGHIAEKLGELLGHEFDKRKVALREPIREIGTHEVTVRLSADVAPKIIVVVTQEGVTAAAETAQAAQPAATAETPTATEPVTQSETPAQSAPDSAAGNS